MSEKRYWLSCDGDFYDEELDKCFSQQSLEDLLNRQDQEIQELKDSLYQANMELYKMSNLENENKELKKQLENAIVPKFKVGQECWGIVPKTFWNKESYTIHFKVKAYIPDNNGIVLMLEDSITNLHYSYEWQVFATKEEAQAKLEELKGE